MAGWGIGHGAEPTEHGPRYGRLVVRRLVLWDIDGTLVRAGDLGAAVFDRALLAVLGRAPNERIRMSGKTDPQIVHEYLDLMEVDEPGSVPEILHRLEWELAADRHRLAAEGSSCDGAAAVLERLDADDRVVQSVLTGNVAANAVVKLAAFGLERWLDVEAGAFGSDDADRRALVGVALARQREMRGRDVAAQDVWVVGDTPDDLACARAGGTRCLLVATGRYPVDELRGAGADAVLADLTDTERVVEILTAGL